MAPEAEMMNLIISDDGIISQFEGYFDLKELDWEVFRKKYGNISRMDRLLKAEGESPDMYKVSKQADTLMVLYNIGRDEMTEIITKLGYDLPDDYVEKNFEYYLQRCSHGSTLSRLVHGYVAARTGKSDLSWELYTEALKSDYTDIQGGTTGEGIHAGVMGGTVLMSMTAYGGLNLQDKMFHIDPALPGHWRELSFRFSYRGDDYMIKISRTCVTLLPVKLKEEINFKVNGEISKLIPGEEKKIEF
jgi:trehalose/maltose hydrolase-like predicted phosphorylase